MCVCVHMYECVPVVWGQELGPGELYCTSVQASHLAETPWEQSRGAESSPTSQRWRTPPEGRHESRYTEMLYLVMWTDFIKRAEVWLYVAAHGDDSPLQPASHWATYWVRSVWEQTLVAKPPPPEKHKLMLKHFKKEWTESHKQALALEISIYTWVHAYQQNY